MINQLIAFLAQYLFLAVLAAAVLAWWRLGRSDKRLFLIYGTVAGILTLVLAKAASAVYFNPRPFMEHQPSLFYHAPGNGFPSDHAMLSFFMAGLVWRFNRRVGAALLLLAAVVGWSRVAAGVHHAIDIVGGAVIALAAISAVLWLSPRLTTLYQRLARVNETA